MGVINIPPNEQDALRRTDTEALRALIEQCLRDERHFALRELPLHECGLFVATKRHVFERALETYSKAKSFKKRADTLYDARSAGNTLLYAVQEMQHRMATEAEEGERFYIDDLITPPYSLSTHLSVRVSYRWRPSPAEAWVSGSITFLYDVDLRTAYTRPPPSRKPSAAKLAEERRERLHSEWEHLKDHRLPTSAKRSPYVPFLFIQFNPHSGTVLCPESSHPSQHIHVAFGRFTRLQSSSAVSLRSL